MLVAERESLSDESKAGGIGSDDVRKAYASRGRDGVGIRRFQSWRSRGTNMRKADASHGEELVPGDPDAGECRLMCERRKQVVRMELVYGEHKAGESRGV
jgi:CRISPR/Cas system-associated protein endoribonuclease Cas2